MGDDLLYVVEIFHSLQGEGRLIGTPSWFVRVAGCNLDCAWCDTKYSRDEKGDPMTIAEIVDWLAATPARDVCLTGGEPLLQNGTFHLLEVLSDKGYRTTVETNGSLPIDPVLKIEYARVSMDIKCPSSLMQDRMLLENIPKLRDEDDIKFVISDRFDMDHAITTLKEYQCAAQVVFQPCGMKKMERLAQWVLREKVLLEREVRVLPQLHKMIWGDKRGV